MSNEIKYVNILCVKDVLKFSQNSEATTGGFLEKKVFLNILQISKENNFVGVSF